MKSLEDGLANGVVGGKGIVRFSVMDYDGNVGGVEDGKWDAEVCAQIVLVSKKINQIPGFFKNY